MSCPKCNGQWSAMGYGDRKCDDCGFTEYSESDEDFNARFGVMPTTSYVVFWMQHGQAMCISDIESLSATLRITKEVRDGAYGDGCTHVTMSCENIDQVGKMGVDAVVDGKTPDGHVYDWNKSSRIGAMKR